MFRKLMGTAILMFLVLANIGFAQSTATLQGTITAATGAVVPGAKIAVHNLATGEERNAESDPAGGRFGPRRPFGTLRARATGPGVATTAPTISLPATSRHTQH